MSDSGTERGEQLPAGAAAVKAGDAFHFSLGDLHCGDSLKVLPGYPTEEFQAVIADPPYFRVLEDESWDSCWQTEQSYLDWCSEWMRECGRVLRPDGLFFVFGQLGKREHIWLHLCSQAAGAFQFHDMLIWDRVVGYNERRDSFTPQYEMILVLKKPGPVPAYFNKDEVRIPYDEKTIQGYLKDRRYKDPVKREAHLRKGKFATNILRVPSLKGTSLEKAGHPAQKPESLISMLVRSSTRAGDRILDPFCGCGTVPAVCEKTGRRWVGIECSEEYTQLAVKRLSGLPGVQPDHGKPGEQIDLL